MSKELSCNSTWFMVMCWLFCIQHFPCLVSLWCMFGGSVEAWTENILYWFTESQTQLGMPRGAKMSLAFNEPHEIGCSSLKFKFYLRTCTITSGKNLLILYAKQPMTSVANQLQTKSSIELRGKLQFTSHVLSSSCLLASIQFAEHAPGFRWAC